jgi:hypothetical protein
MKRFTLVPEYKVAMTAWFINERGYGGVQLENTLKNFRVYVSNDGILYKEDYDIPYGGTEEDWGPVKMVPCDKHDIRMEPLIGHRIDTTAPHTCLCGNTHWIFRRDEVYNTIIECTECGHIVTVEYPGECAKFAGENVSN